MAADRRTVPYVILATLLVLVACDGGLLDVENRDRITTDQLQDPAIAATLVASVVADVECSWDGYVAAAAHHSDHWVPSSGNGNMNQWGARGVTPQLATYATGDCGDLYGVFAPLHRARYQAETNLALLESFSDSEVPNRERLMGRLLAYSGWPFVAFSEGFCGTPLDGGSTVLTGSELAQRAVDRFTSALALLGDEDGDLRVMALVGRARARLALGEYQGVLADAAQVPEGYTFVATRDVSPADRANSHFRAVNGSGPRGGRHASIAPDLRVLEWKGTPDARIGAYTDSLRGFASPLLHWRHPKIGSEDSPVTMASWREARLFMVEAYAMTDRLPEAITILNDFHLRAGLPGVTSTDLPTRDDVLAHLIQERRQELFAEGGHRLRDHLRWRDTALEVPFLGEPGSVHPDGLVRDPDSGLVRGSYGTATCFPVPAAETGS